MEKSPFSVFTYGTGKVEIDLGQKTEKMACVKDVCTAAKGGWVPVCYDG